MHGERFFERETSGRRRRGMTVVASLESVSADVTLVDRRNHHLFQPLLYEVATAALSPGQIAVPLRHVFRRQRNATVVLGEVTAVDLESREVSAAR